MSISIPTHFLRPMSRSDVSTSIKRSSLPLMPSQKAFLALQERARAQVQAKGRKKNSVSGEHHPPRAGSAPLNRPVSPAGPPASTPIKGIVKAGGVNASPSELDKGSWFVSPKPLTVGSETKLRFRDHAVVLDRSIDSASDQPIDA